jgi:hypothetical protein
MVGYELHDFDTEENMGAVIILNENEGGSLEELTDGWEDFNKLEEHELDNTSVDDFVEWFNENYETQIERLTLEFIQIY